jgi:hypothetical protein
VVDVTYYFAEARTTIDDATVTFRAPPVIAISPTVATSFGLATAQIGSTTVVAVSPSVAATVTSPTVSTFGSVSASADASSHAATAALATASLGDILATAVSPTVAATAATATATVSGQIAIPFDVYGHTSFAAASATIGVAGGTQTRNKSRHLISREDMSLRQKGVGVTLYLGQALAVNGPAVKPLVLNSVFAGFAAEYGDPSQPDIVVMEEGFADLDVVGASGQTDIGSIVYALTDDSFTLTSGSGAVAIGRVTTFFRNVRCEVYFEATARRSI